MSDETTERERKIAKLRELVTDGREPVQWDMLSVRDQQYWLQLFDGIERMFARPLPSVAELAEALSSARAKGLHFNYQIARRVLAHLRAAPAEEPRAEVAPAVDVAAIKAEARREAFEEVWRKTFNMNDPGLSNWLLQEMKLSEPLYQPPPAEPSTPPAPAPVEPVTTELDDLARWAPFAESDRLFGLRQHPQGPWIVRCLAMEAALADQRAAVEQATRRSAHERQDAWKSYAEATKRAEQAEAEVAKLRSELKRYADRLAEALRGSQLEGLREVWAIIEEMKGAKP